MTQAPVRQSLTIEAWHPRTSVNGDNARRHWSVIRRNHDIDRDTAWGAAKQAGWVFVPGKVRLTITLVYPRKYRIDADNLAARCKGLIDGLRNHDRRVKTGNQDPPWYGYIERRFFTDDSTDWLDLVVRAEVVPGQKCTKIELEALG